MNIFLEQSEQLFTDNLKLGELNSIAQSNGFKNHIEYVNHIEQKRIQKILFEKRQANTNKFLHYLTIFLKTGYFSDLNYTFMFDHLNNNGYNEDEDEEIIINDINKNYTIHFMIDYYMESVWFYTMEESNNMIFMFHNEENYNDVKSFNVTKDWNDFKNMEIL